jgi:hypothetical protein
MIENRKQVSSASVSKSMAEIVGEATFLYARKLEAYLDSCKSTQEEFLDSYWSALSWLAKAGRDQVAFFGIAFEDGSSQGAEPRNRNMSSGSQGDSASRKLSK